MEVSLLTGPDPLSFKTLLLSCLQSVRNGHIPHRSAPGTLLAFSLSVLGHLSALIQMADRSTSHSHPSWRLLFPEVYSTFPAGWPATTSNLVYISPLIFSSLPHLLLCLPLHPLTPSPIVFLTFPTLSATPSFFKARNLRDAYFAFCFQVVTRWCWFFFQCLLQSHLFLSLFLCLPFSSQVTNISALGNYSSYIHLSSNLFHSS